MRAIDEFMRVNKIEGNIFMSFDLDEMEKCDTIACGALKLECPQFILPVLFDNSTTATTLRYSVPGEFENLEGYKGEFEIQDVLLFYDNILKMLEECGDWFLIPEGFCLDEKQVYINVPEHTIKFVYVPDTARTFKAQDMKHLLISLLEKCNETSGGNIQLQLYKYFYKPTFNSDEFKKMLENFMVSLNIEKKSQPVEEKSESSTLLDETAEAANNLIDQEVENIKQEVDENINEIEENFSSDDIESQIQFTDDMPEKTIIEEEQPEEAEEDEYDASPRTFYTPKTNRSQLSQEEIEEMVKSIYSNKNAEEANASKEKEAQAESVQSTEVADNLQNTGKKKNLFDTVFPNDKQPGQADTMGSEHHAVLKSISTHARYDLPKEIEIWLSDDTFVIGRATRTGEPTGANFEFSAEITPISRLHAKIQRKDGKYYIQDLGSSNGTFVNGKKLEANKPYILKDGDKVAFAIAYSKNSIEYAFTE